MRSGGGTISNVMTDPCDREAAYDFVENGRISAEAVGHAARCCHGTANRPRIVRLAGCRWLQLEFT